MVGTIQLAIMLGAGFGGLLLDHLSIAATFIGSTVLLTIASVAAGCLKSTVPAGGIRKGMIADPEVIFSRIMGFSTFSRTPTSRPRDLALMRLRSIDRGNGESAK
jgi:hypothetical protein